MLNSPLSLVGWTVFLTKVNENFSLIINRLHQGARAIAKKSMAPQYLSRQRQKKQNQRRGE
tara:strand:- start:30 stop:212 length:183 start_codon:yes stop_codon:yes gene_type:complete